MDLKRIVTVTAVSGLILLTTSSLEAKPLVVEPGIRVEIVDNRMSQEDAKKLLDLAIFRYKEGRYEDCVKITQHILDYSDSGLLDDAFYWQGRAFFLEEPTGHGIRRRDTANKKAYDSLSTIVTLFSNGNVIKEGKLEKTIEVIVERLTTPPTTYIDDHIVQRGRNNQDKIADHVSLYYAVKFYGLLEGVSSNKIMERAKNEIERLLDIPWTIDSHFEKGLLVRTLANATGLCDYNYFKGKNRHVYSVTTEADKGWVPLCVKSIFDSEFSPETNISGEGSFVDNVTLRKFFNALDIDPYSVLKKQKKIEDKGL